MMIETHIKETLTLKHWTWEDCAAEPTERQILYEWGIFKVPMNNYCLEIGLKLPHSSDSWQCLMVGSFKINFDGATKGNSGPVGFGGAIGNSKGIVIRIFWGNIGTNTNNLAELEGLING